MLERMVHFVDANGRVRRTYDLLHLEGPDSLVVANLEPPRNADWKGHHDLTRPIGDLWLSSGESPLARVPSAIVPRTWNYLLNPEHPDAVKVKIVSVMHERFDNRVFHFAARQARLA